MHKFKFISNSFILLSAAISCLSFADEQEGETVAVFVTAEPIQESLDFALYYPGGEANMGRTGRVLMSLMIDEDGKAFSPLVLISTNPRFNKAAKKSVTKAQFTPATLNGKPIVSAINFLAVFELDIASLFYRKSNKRYHQHLEKFNTEMASQNPDEKKLRKLLKRMEGTTHGNNFIQRVISRARYDLAELYGSDQEKIDALRELLLSSTYGMSLIKGMPAYFELIKLLVNSGHYGEALRTYDEALSFFNARYQQALRDSFGDAMQEILDIRDSDQAYARNIELNKDGFTYIPLFKNRFTFTDVAGELKKLNFRCDKKYQELPYVVDSDYEVPKSWGSCLLEVRGSKGSKATLIQQ